MGGLTEAHPLPRSEWMALVDEDLFMPERRVKKESVRTQALVIVVWYLVAGAGWILFSDMLLGDMVHDNALLTRLQIVKGWLFLAVTGTLLFLLIRRGFAMIASKNELLAQSEAHYRMLFEKMQNGFALYEAIYDDAGNPVDYRFAQFNPGYEEITGLKSCQVVGRTVREVLPEIESAWLEMYADVVRTGRPAHFGGYSRDLGRHYEVHAYCTGPGTFAVVCIDVTEKRLAEEEVARLTKDLENRVEERTAQYVQANEEISWLNADLLRQKTELEAANAELEAFSFSVSHDLRAPVRNVCSFAQLLQEDYGDRLDRAGQDYLERINTSCRRAEALIDELLQLARISRSSINVKRLDLSAMGEEIAAELLTIDPERQVNFTIPPGIEAQGDETLMRTVLTNLLGNAYKYSGKRVVAAIELGVEEQEFGPVYYVRDNGAGFDMEKAAQLFAPFHRLHRSSEFEGNGVGLAIVQRVIRRHGGDVWARAEVAKGATFYFTLGALPKTPYQQHLAAM
ncbi:ATP-binding protein [Geomonas sp. RF6]|uniref:sensor histidine kinase n=1 Tax=Geomonas sp. RF6 TaxID=2897342 RepID=UPI001E357DB8|nr:ATP-binding protein [Geomonas sp. RF6]UFS71344.1 ATP-binding protein [Geomonas sp. RF6]